MKMLKFKDLENKVCGAMRKHDLPKEGQDTVVGRLDPVSQTEGLLVKTPG
jgi:hypothetical protein